MNVQNNPLVLKAKNTMTTTSSVQTANRKWKAFGTPIMLLRTQGKSPQITSEREKRGGMKKRQQRGEQQEHRKATNKKRVWSNEKGMTAPAIMSYQRKRHESHRGYEMQTPTKGREQEKKRMTDRQVLLFGIIIQRR